MNKSQRMQALVEAIDAWEKNELDTLAKQLTFMKSMISHHDGTEAVENDLTSITVQKLQEYLQ
jgi:hypothetical protein